MKFLFRFFAVIAVVGLIIGGVALFAYRRLPTYVAEQLGVPATTEDQFYTMIKKLAGFEGTRTYLVLLQNYDELRPTGGFIGSYAVVKIQNGKLLDFFSEGTEAIDNRVPFGVAVPGAPLPLSTFLGQGYQYFRDSNWDPNFVKAAPNIVKVYASEHGRDASHIDGVVAVTPELFKTLLQKIGPVTVDGMEFNADNFVDQLEFQAEVGYHSQGISVSNRKGVLKDLATAVAQKVSALSFDELKNLVLAGKQEADEHHVLVFDYDSSIERYYHSAHWDGDWGDTSHDFYAVVDANLGGFKTDRVMARAQEYSFDEKSRTAQLQLTYTNTGNNDYRTRTYKSYTRVYFAPGTQISAVTPPGPMKNMRGKKGFDVYKEDGFTVVGFYFNVPLHATASFTIQTVPPNRIFQQIKAHDYQLFVRKQPGTRPQDLTVQVELATPIVSAEPSGAIDRTQYVFKGALTTDKTLNVH